MNKISSPKLELKIDGDKAQISFSWKWILGIILSVGGLGVVTSGGTATIAQRVFKQDVKVIIDATDIERVVEEQIEPLVKAVAVNTHKHVETLETLDNLSRGQAYIDIDNQAIKSDVGEMRKYQIELMKNMSRLVGRFDTYIELQRNSGGSGGS